MTKRRSYLSAKFFSPQSGRKLIARPRLLEHMGAQKIPSILLLEAPAGSGKSALLQQWKDELHKRDHIASWLSIDTEDNDTTRFLSNLITSIQQVVPSFGTQALGYKININHIIGTMIQDSNKLQQELFVFLDDFHFITEKDVHTALSEFAERCGPHCHLIISTRHTPSLSMARLRAQGMLEELKWDQLRFSREETAKYLLANGYDTLSDKAIDILHDDVDGWAVGLQIATISLRQKINAEEAIKSFSGVHRNVADYFSEDVLLRLQPDIRQFLLNTSILDRMCHDLCNRLTDTIDSRQTISELERLNLFIFPLDEERTWFRYHHLFSEFLLSQLHEKSPKEFSRLSLLASSWFAENDLMEEAIEHALGGEHYAEAGRLLNQCSEKWLDEGQLSHVINFANRLPADILDIYPHVQLCQAVVLALRLQIADSASILKKLRERLGLPKNNSALSKKDSQNELLPRLLHAEMMNAQFLEDAKETQLLCEQLRSKVSHDDDFIHATVAASMINARRHQFLNHQWIDLETEARTYFDRTETEYGPVWLDTILGASKLLSADLQGAEVQFTNAMNLAIKVGAHDKSLIAMPALMLSEIFYEKNRIAEAQTLIEKYLPLAGELGFLDQMIAGYITQARIYANNNDYSKSHAILDYAENYAKARQFQRLSMQVCSERLRQAAASGDIEIVKRLAKHENMFQKGEEYLPKRHATLKDEIQMLAWTRTMLALSNAETTVPVLKRWLRLLDDRECHRSTTMVAVQLSKALLLTGDSAGAKRTLRIAVDRARTGGLIRTFLDEGPAIISMLSNISTHAANHGDLISKTAEMIITDSKQPINQNASTTDMEQSTARPIEPLTNRQIEVLRLASKGSSNSEIADELGLTVGTVKWHFQQIFEHLDTRGRLRAIQRAREIGIIY